MKKILYLVLLAVLATSLSAAPVLVEAYQEGSVSVPGDKLDTVTVIELSFSVDTSCYVQFTAGGLAQFLTMMLLEFDANYLLPVAIVQGNRSLSALIVYTYLITPGEHTIRFRGARIGGDAATFRNAYLQALILLPDEPGAVMEAPPGNNPQSRVHSVVSRGPWVSAPGATELVDASGRAIENAIVAERVQISTLPAGTYFARDGERTVVKIVKVE